MFRFKPQVADLVWACFALGYVFQNNDQKVSNDDSPVFPSKHQQASWHNRQMYWYGKTVTRHIFVVIP